MNDPREAISTFLRSTLGIDVSDAARDLVDSGEMDSLALVELLFFVEQEFGVRVEVEHLELDSLRSVDSIAALVTAEKKRTR